MGIFHKGMNKTLTILFTTLALTGCSTSNSNLNDGSGSIIESNSFSYEVGYELGISGSIGQMIFYGQSDNPTDACRFVIQMSREGTTNDGIDWVSLNEEDFLKGCLAGTDEAHPEAVWNE